MLVYVQKRMLRSFKNSLKIKKTAEAEGTECIWQFGDANYGPEIVGTGENSLGQSDKESLLAFNFSKTLLHFLSRTSS